MPTRASCVPGSNGSRPATGASTSSTRYESEGVGIRVRVRGAWGFAAVRGTDRADAEAALARALAIAEAQPAVPDAAPLAPEPAARGEWSSRFERDPFEVPLEEKLAVLVAADAGLRTEPGVNLTRARFSAFQTETMFASTEGALCEQRVIECGGGISAVAVDRGESQVRSYPASHGGHVEQAGYEHFLELELPGHAPRVAAEAVALLSAPACPHGRTTLLLAGEQLGLQVHESVGHAVELDRVLGPRGLVRRNQLRAGGRHRVAPVRLGARERDGRRHHSGRPRELPVG